MIDQLQHGQRDYTVIGWKDLSSDASIDNVTARETDSAICLREQTIPKARDNDLYLGVSPYVADQEHEARLRVLDQSQVRTAASVIACFNNSIVMPKANVVIDRDNRIYSDSFRALGHLLNDGFVMKEKRRFSREVRVDEVIDQPAILLGIGTNKNYFHWLLEAMPRLLLAREHGLVSDTTLVVVPAMSMWMRDILNSFGFHRNRLIENTGKVYRFSKLIVPSRGLDNIRTFAHHARLTSGEVTVPYSGRQRKLFVSRAKSASRRIINEADVISLAQKFGYEVIFPEDHSFQAQVEIFASASHVAGCLGAGLTNMIFCRPSVALVEFAPEGRTGDATLFANMADMWGARFACAVGAFEGNMDLAIDRRDFKLQLDQAESALAIVD